MHDAVVIYLCCLDAVDATVYAGRVLQIKLRQQQSQARLVHKLSLVPANCMNLDLRATPEFWTAVTHPAAEDTTPGNWHIEAKARRNMSARQIKGITVARTVASAVRLRGGTIQPPYDVPASMDPDSIEAWLEA